jgi:hypothetical protein
VYSSPVRCPQYQAIYMQSKILVLDLAASQVDDCSH